MITELDTNVVVGLMLEHVDLERYLRARRTLERSLDAGAHLLVSEGVMCEVIRVLRERYRMLQSDVAKALTALFEVENIAAWDSQVARGALALLTEEARLDIVDCILIARSAILGRGVISDDRLLSRVIAQIDVVSL